MMPLLELRERVKHFYQRYDMYLTPVIKFLFAFIAFTVINKEIGYDERLDRIAVVLVLSLFSAFTPPAIMVLLASGLAILHVYFVSDILSVIIIIILAILYFLFARFTPKMGYVVLAIPVLFVLRIPYMIPILLGLIATPIAIIPTACGVVVYFLLQIIKSAATMQVNLTIEDALQLYTYVIDNLLQNRQMYLTLAIFSMVLLVVYFVRRLRFDYAFEAAIAVGAIANLLGFLVSYLVIDQSKQILTMILGTIVSAGIVYAIHFFDLLLDYSGVEFTQFEDDVYYYYVKAVPKVTVTTPQRNVKHISGKNESEGYRKLQSLKKYDLDSDSDDEYDDVDSYLDKEKGSTD